MGGWWIPSKNLVTSDRLVRVSRSRPESVTISSVIGIYLISYIVASTQNYGNVTGTARPSNPDDTEKKANFIVAFDGIPCE